MLLDRLELPYIEIGAGNGVFPHAEFRLQGQAWSVGRDIRSDLLPVVEHAPWCDLLADDLGQRFFEDGDFTDRAIGLVFNRADVAFLERIHVQHVAAGG